MRFLIVEDNPKLAASLKSALEEQTYMVDVSHTGHEGEGMAARGIYDGLILDLMLPDYDGVQICRNLRRHRIKVPILILTALSSTDNKVAGLNAGADDYLTKPFEVEELLARLRALLRRPQDAESSSLQFHDIKMDLLKRSVSRGARPIRLTAKEFALLEYFLRSPNRVLAKSQLGERVWDMLLDEESNVVEVYVSRLRRKLGRGFDRQLIHTVIGFGYMLSIEEPAV